MESDLTWNAGLLMDEPSGSDDEETCTLVAAVAAALVSYRKVYQNGNGHRPRSRPNWRIMARWGQLRGYL